MKDSEVARNQAKRIHLPKILDELLPNPNPSRNANLVQSEPLNFDIAGKLYSALDILKQTMKPLKAFSGHDNSTINTLLKESFDSLIDFVRSGEVDIRVIEKEPAYYEVELRNNRDDQKPMMTFSIRSSSELYSIDFDTGVVNKGRDSFKVSFNNHGSGPLAISGDGKQYFLAPGVGDHKHRLNTALKDSGIFETALNTAKAIARAKYDAEEGPSSGPNQNHNKYLYGCFMNEWPKETAQA